jgi:hypothetical protein
VRSTKNFVYRSKDEGKNWEKQNWKMEKSGSEEEGALKAPPLGRKHRAHGRLARARTRYGELWARARQV